MKQKIYHCWIFKHYVPTALKINTVGTHTCTKIVVISNKKGKQQLSFGKTWCLISFCYTVYESSLIVFSNLMSATLILLIAR